MNNIDEETKEKYRKEARKILETSLKNILISYYYYLMLPNSNLRESYLRTEERYIKINNIREKKKLRRARRKAKGKRR